MRSRSIAISRNCMDPLRAQLPERCVLDGEIVIVDEHGLDFEALQLRLHPAASRVKLLAGQIPASVVFFDLLCEGDRDSAGRAVSTARATGIALSSAAPPLHLTPATRDRAVAADWFRRFEGAGLDGVMAKPVSGIYEPNKRVMLKVKHERDCDCVVAGFRWHKKGEGTRSARCCSASIDDAGALQHVGVCASFTDEKRQELVEFLAPYRKNASRIIRGSNGPSMSRNGGTGQRCQEARAAGVRARIFVGTPAAGTGGRGCLRPHAGQPVSAHCAVSAMAHRQEARRLHLCAARGCAAAGA